MKKSRVFALAALACTGVVSLSGAANADCLTRITTGLNTGWSRGISVVASTENGTWSSWGQFAATPWVVGWPGGSAVVGWDGTYGRLFSDRWVPCGPGLCFPQYRFDPARPENWNVRVSTTGGVTFESVTNPEWTMSFQGTCVGNALAGTVNGQAFMLTFTDASRVLPVL